MNIKPAFAGRFYPAEKDKLVEMLYSFFESAENPAEEALAVISPHAGYVFSGKVAASAMKQINPDKKYTNVFVITSSHSHYFKGASVYNKGNYETVFGEIEVNKDIADDLILKNNLFNCITDAHTAEHSLEVHLPILKYYLKHDFNLVPIIIGDADTQDCIKIAGELKNHFCEENLFIISSDFSHFPEYKDAVNIDKKTAESICSNSAEIFLNTIRENKNSGIRELATDICGKNAVLCLLYMTQNAPYQYQMIDYQNSGDSVYGDHDSVVGYHAIAVFKDKSSVIISEEEQKYLLRIARDSIFSHLSGRNQDIIEEDISDSLKLKCGAFVTLRMNNALRGCLGRFDSDKFIPETIANLAPASATRDYRFSPLTIDELSKVKIELSILTPMRKIHSIDEIKVGKHGIYIIKDGKAGTFLPEVATDMGWDKIEFLNRCADNKAGIGQDGWKDADIYIYETIKFSE
jgi:MEMO1 family protein